VAFLQVGVPRFSKWHMFQACGPMKPLKRLITPANKPQGFGFCEFQDPDGTLRAMDLLNGVELPALEDGCANKKLLVFYFSVSILARC
jgi:RNA-binding protein 25